MAADRQHIEPGDRQTIGALLRRIEAARRFPDNTDPCVRHVQLMGETLGAGRPYPMLDEERGHCATSLLAVVAALYEARNALAALGVAPSQAPSEEQVLAAVREVGGLVYDNGAISFMRAEYFLAAVAALGVGGNDGR